MISINLRGFILCHVNSNNNTKTITSQLISVFIFSGWKLSSSLGEQWWTVGQWTVAAPLAQGKFTVILAKLLIMRL